MNAHSVAAKQHNAVRLKNYFALRFSFMGQFLYLLGKFFSRVGAEMRRFDCLSMFLSSTDK